MPDITVGEMELLRSIGPRHPAGDTFDLLDELRIGHGAAHLCAPSLWHVVYPELARSLAGRGLLEAKGDGLWSLSDAGEAYWKSSLAHDWKHARQGAGVSWKKAQEATA